MKCAEWGAICAMTDGREQVHAIVEPSHVGGPMLPAQGPWIGSWRKVEDGERRG